MFLLKHTGGRMYTARAHWGPPHWNCVIETPGTEHMHQILGVAEYTGTPALEKGRVPIVIQGKDLDNTEFIALTMKLNKSVYEAAVWLRKRGWTLEQTHHLLCIRGKQVI